MPLTPLDNSSAGAPDPEKGARNLMGFASWVYRRCSEIAIEGNLDVLKIYDLAHNCQNFRAELERWRDKDGNVHKVVDWLAKLTNSSGKGNAVKGNAEINGDYLGLYDACGVFLAWASTNLPPQGHVVPGAVVTVNRTWPSPDMTVRVPKSQAVSDQVAALRNAFD